MTSANRAVLRSLWLVSITLGCVTEAMAGVSVYSGTEAGFWTNRAVIVGRVAAVGSSDQLEIEVLAVVSTEIVVPTRLTMRYKPLSFGSALKSVDQGEVALFVIERTDNGWTLPTNLLKFMPSGNAISPVEGIDDAQVAELEQAIRELRIEARQPRQRGRE